MYSLQELAFYRRSFLQKSVIQPYFKVCCIFYHYIIRTSMTGRGLATSDAHLALPVFLPPVTGIKQWKL